MQDVSLFDLLVLSLGNAALVGLGFVPEPETGQTCKDLHGAEHNIELIAMLQEKTRGNLNAPEANLIETMLYDLRLKYVEARRQP